jgi:putative transcriptional regulator
MSVKVLLKEMRMARGLSQNGLAQKLGMTLQNIQKIEYGKSKGIQFDVLGKLCQVLDCQPSDLLVYVEQEEEAE